MFIFFSLCLLCCALLWYKYFFHNSRNIFLRLIKIITTYLSFSCLKSWNKICVYAYFLLFSIDANLFIIDGTYCFAYVAFYSDDILYSNYQGSFINWWATYLWKANRSQTLFFIQLSDLVFFMFDILWTFPLDHCDCISLCLSFEHILSQPNVSTIYETY